MEKEKDNILHLDLEDVSVLYLMRIMATISSSLCTVPHLIDVFLDAI